MLEYRAKSGKAQFKPELYKDVEMSDFDDGVGWCLACGNLQYGCEPDARRYLCEECEKPKVYGLSELAIMGLIG